MIKNALAGKQQIIRIIIKWFFCVQMKEYRPPKSADAYLVLFSVVDKNSFETAETILKKLQEHEMLRSKPAILVGNKVDMARSREVSAQGNIIIRTRSFSGGGGGLGKKYSRIIFTVAPFPREGKTGDFDCRSRDPVLVLYILELNGIRHQTCLLKV